MHTNDVYFPFFSTDVPQQEIEDPKMRKLMLIIGAAYMAVVLLICALA